MESLSDLIGAFGSLLGQILCHAGAFAQSELLGRQRGEHSEAVRVGSDGTGEDVCIPAVILGTCGGEPVPKAIRLPGIDDADLKAPIQQRVHHGTVRTLNGNSNLCRNTADASKKPSDPITQPFPGVGKGFLSKNGALGVNAGKGSAVSFRIHRIFVLKVKKNADQR